MSMTLESFLDDRTRRQALEDDVRSGLGTEPRTLPPKYFYDARGSRLFDEITRLPEYYLTGAERAVLERVADRVVSATGADSLVELGSGTSEKTRLLLDAMHQQGVLRRFYPFDVDSSVLQDAGRAISADYPGIQVHGVVGDFERHLDRLPQEGRRLVAFLGSTMGNLEPVQRGELLSALRASLRPGEHLLLGTDLVKDRDRLLAAYNDSAGMTATFNRNVLSVLNAELDADFVPDLWSHEAVYDARMERIEMRLRTDVAQHVSIGAIDLTFEVAAGDHIRTETSAKFRRTGVDMELTRAGFAMEQWWTDPAGDFAVSLSRAC